MPDPTPQITVIIACKDPGLRLKTSLASVWSQIRHEPELIVVDGGSTDGSREWLEENRARITRLIIEPGLGLYDAMNRAVAAARGEWLLFLGPEGRLAYELTLNDAAARLTRTEAGVAVGEVSLSDGHLRKFRRHINPRARDFVHPQGAFYRRTLFAENEGFDSAFAVMADYEFNLRLWKNHVRFKPLPVRVSISDTPTPHDAAEWRTHAEEIRARHRYFSVWRCWFWDLLSLLRFARKKISFSIPTRHPPSPDAAG